MPTIHTSDDQEQRESLKLIIEEQRRDFDYLLHIYDRAGAKENVLLTATFGILAYLYYSAAPGTAKTIQARLFIPSEDYGKVIYIMVAGFFLYGLFKLMFNVFGDNNWETAYETSKTDYSHDSLETLQYVKQRYDAAYQTNISSYNTRRRDLRFCFYCILISATILIVIKTLT